MNNKRRLILLFVGVLLALALVACGGGSNGSENTADETEGVVEPTSDAAVEEPVVTEPAAEGGEEVAAGTCGPVELQYWNPFTGPDGPFMGEMVDAFNGSQENINVVMTTQSEYYTQLSTAAASGTLPDVAIVHADQVATQAFRNVLRPIDDVVAAAGIDGANFPTDVWNAGEVAGQRYSIPLDIHPMTMFYNADLLSAAGFDAPPTTGEEFAAVAGALSDGTNNGFMITSGFPIRQIFEMLLYQFGGTSFTEDGAEAAWNGDAGVQAMNWLLQAQSDWSQPNLEVDAELNAFKGGTVGMIWNGIWQTTNVTGEGVEFNGQATAVPQIGPQPAVWGGSHQLTLPTQAEPDPCKDAAAGQFISYLLDNSVTWAKAGQLPANSVVRTSDEFMAIEPQASIASSAEHVFIPPSVPGITDAYAPLDEAVAALMAGTATDVQASLDDAANRANQILADNRDNYGEAP
ncbi:MAG: ABC transporter substrate-binding protein [Candidatus Promineofilum sp.]|nr:ABC transporter substrate-binding protein [Promineifilum sp.]